jgi:O-antigen ligase
LARGARTSLTAIIAAIVIVAATVPIWYRADWPGAVLPFQNLLARMDFWGATVVALKDHLFTGLGLSGWWSSVNTAVTLGGPHSSYLQLYSDTGPFGLIAWLAAVLVGTRQAIKVLHADRNSPFFGLTLGLIAGCVAASADAAIENIFLVLIPVGGRPLALTVPLVWLLMAGLVLSGQKLFQDERTRTASPT